MHDLTDEQLQKICWLMNHCGQQAKQLATEEFQVYEKAKNDYVTSVDRLLDQQLAEGFHAIFPADGVITEEDRQSQTLFREGHRRLWLIDPIDGTEDLIRGNPHYAVMVGLLEEGQPVAGWVYAPELDHLYYGGPGWGLFQSVSDRPPHPLLPQEPAPPSDTFCPIMMGDKDQRNFGDAISQWVPAARFDTIGSFGLKVMQVILGHAGLYVYFNGRVKLWDTTGPLALARAAGLVCCDLDGNPIEFTLGAVDATTLTHQQPIVIGWPSYVTALRSPIRQAVQQQRHKQAGGEG